MENLKQSNNQSTILSRAPTVRQLGEAALPETLAPPDISMASAPSTAPSSPKLMITNSLRAGVATSASEPAAAVAAGQSSLFCETQLLRLSELLFLWLAPSASASLVSAPLSLMSLGTSTHEKLLLMSWLCSCSRSPQLLILMPVKLLCCR